MSFDDDIVPTAPHISSVDVADGIPEMSSDIVARNTQRIGSIAPARAELNAAAQTGDGMGQSFWRSLTRSLDMVIKLNSTAQVIPSAEAIATEVLRQQHLQRIEQNGSSLIWENMTAHTVEADMIKDSSMAYREIGGGGS